MPTPRAKGGRRGIGGTPPKHGARALARHLAAGTLDRRTWIAKELDGIADALAADRGGWSNVSAGERILIERVAAEVLFLRAIEGWAFRQESIVEELGVEGPRLLAPLAKGYTSHLSAMTRALAALGLRPDKVDRLPSLGEYLQQREQTNGNGHSAAQASAAPPIEADACPAPADAADAAQSGDGTTTSGSADEGERP